MRRPVVLAAVIALAVRVLLVARGPVSNVTANARDVMLAQSLAHAHRFADAAGTATAEVPVGYPSALAAVLLFGVSVATALAVINIGCAMASASMAAALGAQVSGPRGGYLAGLATALLPGSVLASIQARPALLLGVVLVAVVLVASPDRATPRETRALGLTAGGLVGLAALVSPTHLVMAPWVGANCRRRGSLRAGTAVWAALAAMVVTAPWAARNANAVGGWTLSTDAGANLVAGTADDGAAPDARCGTGRTEAARDVCRVHLARARIADDTLAWAKRAFARIAVSDGVDLVVSERGLWRTDGVALLSSDRTTTVCTIAWWGLIALAVVGGRRMHRRGGRWAAEVQLVVGFALLEVLGRAFGPGGSEHHLALVPLLAVLTAGVFLPARPIDKDPELVWVT